MIPRAVSMAIVVPAVASGALLFTTAAAAAVASSESFTASLSGSNEVGGGGTASGTATVTVDQSTGQVCATVTTTVKDAVAMHIHKGASGVNGPVVVPLDVKSINGANTCVSAKPDVAKAIAANPSGYYVNIHTPAKPKGVERGQLAAAAPSGANAGSGGQGGVDPGPNVVLIAVMVAGAGLAGAAGWRLVRR